MLAMLEKYPDILGRSLFCYVVDPPSTTTGLPGNVAFYASYSKVADTVHFYTVSRQLVYGHFVYDTKSTDISSTDISSTMTLLAEIEAGVMKRILYK